MTNEEFIEELETVDTEIHKIKRYDRNSSSDLRDIALKINEIADVVNAIIDELFVEVHAKINIDGTSTRDCIDASQIIQGKISSKLYDVGGNVVEEFEPQIPYVEYTEIDKGN